MLCTGGGDEAWPWVPPKQNQASGAHLDRFKTEARGRESAVVRNRNGSLFPVGGPGGGLSAGSDPFEGLECKESPAFLVKGPTCKVQNPLSLETVAGVAWGEGVRGSWCSPC